MKKHRKVVHKYSCEICKTKYGSASEALACEKKPVEQVIAKIGDRVRIEIKHECGCSKKYFPMGKITAISGPQPPDFETEVKWLGGLSERLNSHVLTYDVSFACPRCRKKKETRCFAPELCATARKKA